MRINDHSVSQPALTAWRFAHAVLGLEDLEKSVTQTAVRDELTYTSNEWRTCTYEPERCQI